MDATERARIIEKAMRAFCCPPNKCAFERDCAVGKMSASRMERALSAIGYFETREALEPFVDSASGLPLESFAGEIGEYYRDGLRVSIKYEDLRRVRAALKKGE